MCPRVGLSHFFREIGQHVAAAPAVVKACAVFEARTLLVEEIQRVARGRADADRLKAAVSNFLQCYHSVIGPASMTQKFHCLHHLSDYVKRLGASGSAVVLDAGAQAQEQQALCQCATGRGCSLGRLGR